MKNTSEQLTNQNFMAVIMGPTASGKDCVIDPICRQYPSVHKIVSFTTRQCRPNETNGIDYHFLTDEEYTARKGEFVLETQRVMKGKTVYYGMAIDDLLAVSTGKQTICHIDLNSLETLMNTVEESSSIGPTVLKKIIPIYLGVPHLTLLKDRYFSRHRVDDEKEAFRERIRADWNAWTQFQSQIAYTVMNDQPLNSTIQQIVSLINAAA